MEDVKEKMKGILKKVNTPFSSSSSSFSGHGRVLGSSPSSSSSSTPSNSSSSRLLPNPPPSRPATKISTGFDPYNPLVTSVKRLGSDIPTAASVVECPICSSSFPSEEAVSAHIDSCIRPSAGAVSGAGVSSRVGEFMSGDPSEGSVEIVTRLLKNVAGDPRNERFRKIRLGNPRIKEAIGDARGGLELLECVGFRVKEEDGEKWAAMDEPPQGRIDVIREAISLLEGWKTKDAVLAVNGDVERLVPDQQMQLQKIDRKVRVFFSVPESVAAKIDLSDSFYKLSTEELRRESDARRKKIADSQLLIPRSYKEKQAMASRKKYKLSVIRIQFPDRVVLQGVFLPWERTTALYEFVSSSLKEANLEFELLSPAVPRVQPIRRFPGADGRTPTLEEENLVPSALVKFKPVETDSVAFTGLADEILERIEPLTGAATLL